MKYWLIDPITRVVSPTASTAKMRGGVAHVPVDALTVKPLRRKQGHAVVALEDLSGSAYIADHRGETHYDMADASVSKTMTELGEIPDGWTSQVPKTPQDVWRKDKWVSDRKKAYQYKYDTALAARQSKYAARVRPLVEEAELKKFQGRDDEYQALMQQAVDERAKIQAEEPWPKALARKTTANKTTANRAQAVPKTARVKKTAAKSKAVAKSKAAKKPAKKTEQ